jgi:hypothetical protein
MAQFVLGKRLGQDELASNTLTGSAFLEHEQANRPSTWKKKEREA